MSKLSTDENEEPSLLWIGLQAPSDKSTIYTATPLWPTPSAAEEHQQSDVLVYKCATCGESVARDTSPGLWIHDADVLGDLAFDLDDDHAPVPVEGTAVADVTPLMIMGLHEISVMIGVRPNTITTWERRGHMPPPDARLACGPVWRESTIVAWANGPGRERIARLVEG